MAGFIVTEAVGVIWMFMMFAVVRWVAKKLRRPDRPALIVALTAYVVTVLLGSGCWGGPLKVGVGGRTRRSGSCGRPSPSCPRSSPS